MLLPRVRNAMLLAACALTAGCAHLANGHPAIGYADRHHPQSDTAIVACAQQTGYFCGIAAVDERGTWNHFQDGRTLWARVLPGKRMVRFTAADGTQIVRPTITIADAQPGHVYRVSFASVTGDSGPTLAATVTDLGRMDSYTIHIPRFPLSPLAATAHF